MKNLVVLQLITQFAKMWFIQGEVRGEILTESLYQSIRWAVSGASAFMLDFYTSDDARATAENGRQFSVYQQWRVETACPISQVSGHWPMMSHILFTSEDFRVQYIDPRPTR